MVGYGIASFVEGFQRGHDWRQGVDDRKSQRERRETLQERDDTRWQREQELWKRQDSEYDRAAAERRRQEQDRAWERGLFRDANAAAQGGEVDPREAVQPGLSRSDVSAAPMPSRIDVETLPPPATGSDAPRGLGAVRVQGMDDGEPGSLPGARAPDRALAPSRGDRPPAAADDIPVAARPPRIDEPVAARPPAAADDIPVAARPPRIDEPVDGASGGLVPRGVSGRERPALSEDEQKRMTPSQIGAETVRTLAETAGPSAEPAREAAMVARESATPSQRQAMARGSGKPMKATPKQLERGSKAYIDRWFEAGLPVIVEGYLAKGMVDKAMAFQKWADTRDAKKGMEAVGRGMAAASIGDFDAVADSLADAYNTAGFFDDGLTVDKARTGPIRDDDGNVTGVNLAFRDDAGNLREQQVQGSMAELLPLFANAISPEKAFEYHYERAQAAGQARASQIKSERDFNEWVQKEMIRAGLKGDGRRGEVIDMIRQIEENLPLGAPRPSDEEMIRMAIERLRILDQAMGGARGAPQQDQQPPPVMRRPQ